MFALTVKLQMNTAIVAVQYSHFDVLAVRFNAWSRIETRLGNGSPMRSFEFAI